jgi:hypothetical protein
LGLGLGQAGLDWGDSHCQILDRAGQMLHRGLFSGCDDLLQLLI